MKRIYLLLILFCSALGFAQSVTLHHPMTGAVYPAEQYFCAAEAFDLKVDAVATSTGDYQIIRELPSNYPISAGSTDIKFAPSGSDKFSEAFPIGFTFSFYGKNYTKAVMGSNGRLVFTNSAELENLKDNNTYIDRTFSGVPNYNAFAALPSTDYNKVYRSNPSQQLNLAQIFFGYTDLMPLSLRPSVKYLYKNVTIGGVRAILVSFQNQIRTNGSGAVSGVSYESYVIMFEDGRIVVYVNNKTEDHYNAILGIQNDDASKFRVPTHSNTAYNYNNGKWKSEGVAWLFKPNQNLTPQFKWFRSGAQIPGETTNTISGFLPNDGDVLEVEATYHDPAGVQVGAPVSDEVQFKLLKTPQISTPTYAGGCGNPAEIRVVNPDPKLIYHWYSDTDASFHQTGTSILVGNGSYYVQVQNTAGNCTLKSTSETVNITSSLPPFVFENQIIRLCDKLGLASETFNLASVTGYPTGTDYSVEYFEGTSTTAISSASVLSGQTKTFTIKVSTNPGVTPACSFSKDFSISYVSFPPDGQIYTSAKLCEDAVSYTATDFKNNFFAGSAFQFMFSTDETNFNLSSVNPQVNPVIWVKITEPNFSCESIVKLNFDFHPKVTANAPVTQLPPQCANATETFDLASLIPEINADPDVTVTFHQSLPDAQTGARAVSYSFRGGLGYTTLYIRAVDNISGCVAQTHPDITLLVYYKPTLIKNNVAITHCEGNTIFDLTQNVSDLVNASPQVNVTLEYYSPTGVLLTGSQITDYDESVSGANPYIKVVYNPTCSDMVSFNLNYNPKPVARITQIPICGETVYPLQDFKDKVIANASQYSFTDDAGNALPASFDVTALPLTVKFLIKNNNTGCVSDVQTLTFAQGVATALTATETDYVLCDADFDGRTEFNLEVKKTVFTADPTAIFEYFKDALFNVKIDNFTHYINETAFTQPVYIRITTPGNCPSFAKINLIVNVPAKSSTLLDKYYICYGETITIDAGPENDTVTWSDGHSGAIGQFTAVGTYSVILQNGPDGCPYTHDFVISDENQPKIDVINQTNNSIEVIANGGVQPYRYYFNGVPQASNILLNPAEPYYEIQVESATGCMGPPKTIYFIKINNAFTPDSDGINDVWRVENLDKMESVSLVIVDRWGSKVFESQNKNKLEWDGRSGGRKLASSTYWFTLTWFDAVTQKSEQRQGWILMKNRN